MFYLFCGHASASSLVSKKILVRALSRNGLKFFMKYCVIQTSVSNETGQSNFSGERDRSSFITPGQRAMGQAQNFSKGRDRQGQPVQIQDGTWAGTVRDFDSPFRPVPQDKTGQSRNERFKTKKFILLNQILFHPIYRAMASLSCWKQ